MKRLRKAANLRPTVIAADNLCPKPAKDLQQPCVSADHPVFERLFQSEAREGTAKESQTTEHPFAAGGFGLPPAERAKTFSQKVRRHSDEFCCNKFFEKYFSFRMAIDACFAGAFLALFGPAKSAAKTGRPTKTPARERLTLKAGAGRILRAK